MLKWIDRGPLHIGHGKFIYQGEEVPLGILTPEAIESLKKKGKLEEINVVVPVVEPKAEEPKAEEPKDDDIKPIKKTIGKKVVK